MRPQHGAEFSMKELNSTSWNAGENPQVCIVHYENLIIPHSFDLFLCHRVAINVILGETIQVS